ncbi:tetratricopeptide repeat protein [Novipirellula caenicola]|uniref:Cell division coordinator CpoB n=1 Tax=Novipirellula caenicola TaxID=1536901 RepID=A0ABP9W1I9_9BACT
MDWPPRISSNRIAVAILVAIGVFACAPRVGVAQQGDNSAATAVEDLSAPIDDTASTQPSPHQLYALIQSHFAAGNLADASQVARKLDQQLKDSPTPDIDLTLPLAQIGRAFQNAGDATNAVEFFSRANAALERPASKTLPPATVVLVRLAAASLFVHAGRLDVATETLKKTLVAESGITAEQTPLAVDLCLRIGRDSLTKQDLATAETAYILAAEHAAPAQKPTAMLGAAWAVAMSGKRMGEAADRMIAFLKTYPDHPDAARASQAGIACLKQVGRDDEAEAMIIELFHRWPDSDAAKEVLNQFGAVDIDKIPEPLRNLVLRRDFDQLTPAMTSIAIRIAAAQGDSNAWDRLVNRLGKIDQTGQTTADLLSQLPVAADAERLALYLLSPPATSTIQAKSRESACRWAGRHERWSMLALASQSTSPAQQDPTRTITMERLFAEALMQTGRRAEAHVWWCHVVDELGADDFATLLRCAETEVSIGEVDRATQRVEAATAAAGDDRYRTALVAMLSAELGIRRLRFDEARSDLESVVRSSQVDASLRGRAQWMIGETYYLQQRYVEAIEAYRGVAGIDPDGTWVVASLVQAGKSFEQLGRTRDAAVCYSTLVSRHGDSEFAVLASRRLAALSPSDGTTPTKPGSPSNTPNKTLRR